MVYKDNETTSRRNTYTIFTKYPWFCWATKDISPKSYIDDISWNFKKKDRTLDIDVGYVILWIYCTIYRQYIVIFPSMQKSKNQMSGGLFEGVIKPGITNVFVFEVLFGISYFSYVFLWLCCELYNLKYTIDQFLW